jgi:VWFA-related protein
VWQDDQPRTFQLAQPQTPMAILLLVEYSEASWPYFNDIADAISSFVDAALPGNWYALATFAHNVQVRVDFTQRTARIPAAFDSIGQPLWSDVDTYDSVDKALDMMSRISGRKAIIFIGSGFDNFSGSTLGDVEKKIEGSNVTLYAIGAGSLFRGMYQQYLSGVERLNLYQAQSFMQMMANYSGGDSFFPDEEGAIPDDMQAIMQELKSQYRIVYTPDVKPDGKLHPVKVKAFEIANDKRQDFKVRVRKGWIF